MDNTELVRQLLESNRRQAEKEQAMGINKPMSTIRHLEAASDGTNANLLTALPAFAQEAT